MPDKLIGLHVVAAHSALLTLIGLTPVVLFFDGWLARGLIALYSAVCLVTIAVSIRPGESGHWVRTMRWMAALAAFPLAWLVIQLLPLPLGAISRSVWQTAAAALNASLWPRTTIDPGLTLLALCWYVTLVAVGFVVAAISIDRQQAEKILLALGAATLVISLVLIADQLGDGGLLGAHDGGTRWAGAAAGSAYGVVLLSAITIMVFERYLTRPLQWSRSQFPVGLAGALAGLATCLFAAFIAAPQHAIFAAVCGLSAVALIYCARRIGLAWYGALAVAGLAIMAAAAVATTKGNPTPVDISLRFAGPVSADRISVTNRILSEVGIGGSGAGTFAAIQRIYAAQSAATAEVDAPTFASRITVELGRPALWIIVASMVALIVLCARGGFSRGRDFFYPIAGAGVGITSLVLAFCDIGLSNPAISILLAATFGLALVQSVSRAL